MSKYPDVTVNLVGEDGNVFVIIGKVTKALKLAHGKEAAEEYTRAAFACKSYDAVLRLTMDTVEVGVSGNE